MNNFASFDNDELLALSDWNFQNNLHENALEKLKVLVRRDNAPLQSHALIGRIYATLGLFEKAKISFTFYLENQTNHRMKINETFQLGLVERDLGNIDNALHVWDELLKEHPKHTPCLYNKAVILVEIKQYQKAADLLNSILEIAEDNDQHIQLADQLLSRIALQ